MTLHEHVSGEVQMYDFDRFTWAKIADLSDGNVLTAGTRRQCCEDGAFGIGGCFAGTLHITCKLPGLTRYQIKGARILLRRWFDGEALTGENAPAEGIFWVTDAQKCGDIFTLSGQDAMGWTDTSSLALPGGGGADWSFGDIVAGRAAGNAATLEYWLNTWTIPPLNDLIAAQTGIPAMLTWSNYNTAVNGHYCNQMLWGETYGDGESDAPAYFFIHTDDGVYKTDTPRDVLRWVGELTGGFLTVRKTGELTMRQFGMAELGTAVVPFASTGEGSFEVADYTIYLYNAGAIYADSSFYAIGGNPSHRDVNIRYTLQSNPFLSGFMAKDTHAYTPAYGLWHTRDIGAGAPVIRPFRVMVHGTGRYELGQRIRFPDFHDIGEAETHDVSSIITGIEWTYRGGTLLSCGGDDARVMADCIRATKADRVLRELRSRFRSQS